MDSHEEIKQLEDELRKTQYNKATEHHFGVVKARIAKLKEKIEKRQSSKKGGEGFAVKKSGDATVVLLGFPSVGKSTLLNALTNAQSKVGAYEFTTLEVIPGVLEYNQAKIQILDVPGILEGAASGRGRGKEVLSMVRNADLIIMLLDALHPEHNKVILKEIADIGVRANQKKPVIKIVKKIRGGISISSTVPLNISKNTIETVLREFKLVNVDVVIREQINIDQLIDVIEGNKVYIPAITVISKIDLVDQDQLNKIQKEVKPNVFVSAEKKININKLKEEIYNALRFIRIYLKEINKKPDLEEPMIMKQGTTVRNICEKIHKDFITKFRFAKFWGSSKFPGQAIRKLDKELKDKDIIEFHLR